MPFGFGKVCGSAKMTTEGRAGRRKWKGGCGHGGPPVNCICPQCGLMVPHEPGTPCFQRKCPQCGSFMARQFIKIE
jgi:hypothetical protein